MAIHGFGMAKGANLRERELFDTRLARAIVPHEDRSEILTDAISSLYRSVSPILLSTEIKHRFGYFILSNGDLLLGVDKRDLSQFNEAPCED